MSSLTKQQKKEDAYALFLDSVFLSMRFPQKLWKIVNECNTGAIQWNNKGRTILLDYKKFHEEYLNNCETSMFKTKNINSFIRQLNLYGFRKVTSHNRDPLCNLQNPDIHEFLHDNFQSGRSDLLRQVSRKAGRSKNKTRGKQCKKEESKFPEMKNRPGTRLTMCRLALKEALEKAVRQYRRERWGWENEDPLAEIANSNSQEAVSELFGFDFNSIPNAEANMEWINKNSSLLSPTFKMVEEIPAKICKKVKGEESWMNEESISAGAQSDTMTASNSSRVKSSSKQVNYMKKPNIK